MHSGDYLQLDVFADAPGRGNPLGVVFGAEALDAPQMQALAAWLGLSETTFVLPATEPTADYRLRIFTPRQELPFAGHPSVGTAHAVLKRGLVVPRDGALRMQCAAGVLPLQVSGQGDTQRIAVRAPRAAARDGDASKVLASLGGVGVGALPATLMDNGPRWWCVELVDEVSVRSLSPDLRAMAAANRADASVGVAVFARCTGQTYALVVRAFVPADGIDEDPVTGSANACIAALLHQHWQLPADRFTSSQGREMGRDGLVEMAVDTDGEVWIGGHTQTVIEGTWQW